MQEVEEAAKACVCHNLRKSSTITEISKEMYTDRTTLTRSLELLEKQAFIQIESSGDRRKRIVTITSKGKARMDKAFPLWEKAQDTIMEKFGKGKWREIKMGLNEISDIARFSWLYNTCIYTYIYIRRVYTTL